MSDDAFVSDAEIAKRWQVGEKTARIAIKEFEKRRGFPPRDPLFGGKRFWPAVQAFMLRRAGISIAPSMVTDGEEDWNATGSKNRGRARPAVAPAR